MFWNENKECMPREQMRELQGKRLQKLVQKENAGDGLVSR